MTPRPEIRIHDLSTGEILDREMNDEEFAKWESAQKTFKEEQAMFLKKESEKQALLTRLGLSADELATLLG